jgi:signal transduction histidine kinase
MIVRQVTLQARLMDDLLDLARLGRHGLAVAPEPTDLHALLREVVDGCRAAAQQKGQRLTTRLRASGPVVHGDPGRLRQVFSNLLRNAVKFTPTGGRIAVRSRNGPEMFSGLQVDFYAKLLTWEWRVKRSAHAGVNIR